MQTKLRLSIDAQEFKSAITGLKNSISKKANGDILLYALIERDFSNSNLISIETTKLDLWITKKVTTLNTVEDFSKIALYFSDLEALVKLIKLAKNETASVTVEEYDDDYIGEFKGTFVKIKKYNFTAPYVVNFPKSPKHNDSGVMCLVDYKSISSGINCIKYAVSKDKTKRIFTGINLDAKNQKIQATDGLRMAYTEIETKENNGDVIFTSSQLEAAINSFASENKDLRLRLYKNECCEYFQISGHNTIATGITYSGDPYLNLADFLPTRNMANMEFETSVLKELLEVSCNIVGSAKLDTYLDISVRNNKLATFSINESKISKEIPCKASHDLEVTFKLDVLMDTVKFHKGKLFTITHPLPGDMTISCAVKDEKTVRILARCERTKNNN